jgi:capsular exopolysaccharide synthesis family protein
MENNNSAAGGLTVLDYLRPVWRFKIPVILVVVIAAAGTYLYTNRKPKLYQSSATLYVGQSSLESLLNPASTANSVRTVADQAALLRTPAVAALVQKQLRLGVPPAALLGSISASPSASGDFLDLISAARSPRLAAALANGFAQAYLKLQTRNVVSGAKASLLATQARLKQLGHGVNDATARTGLQQQISTLEGIVASPPPSGQQLAPAPVPAAPVSPKPKNDAIFAAVIALALGVIASYLVDRHDRRVRQTDDMDSLLDIPVLASIPHARRAELRRVAPDEIPETLRESFRSLRVNLDIARAQRDGAVPNAAKVIMITSAIPDEGKSTIVRNLALSFWEAGARVAVVEADLRRGVLAERFGVAEKPGLSEALADGDHLLLQPVPTSDPQRGALDILVAGRAAEDPTVLLSEPVLADRLAQLATDYDVIFIDSPPLLPVSDSLPLLGMADGVLVVVRFGTSTREAAAKMRQTIERVGGTRAVRLLGIVANDTSDTSRYYVTSARNGHPTSIQKDTEQALR